LAFSSAVLFSSSLWVRTTSSTTLHAASNATFTLYLAGTTTPATIYSDANFTVLNTTGAITTDTNGNWSAWLARDNNYQINYLGVAYPAFDPDPTGQELQTELATHAGLTSGVHGATNGDNLVSTSAMNTAIANAASGGATPDATSSVKGKLQLAGDLSGSAASPAITTGLRNLITNAVQTSQVGAVSGVASLDGTGKVPSAQIPTGVAPDATTGAKGIVQLTNDLAGTAAAPAIETTLRAKITGAIQTTARGAANGVASLDAGGLVPSAQLPAGGFSGNFSGAAASNFKASHIAKSTAFSPTIAESGSFYSCNTGTTTGFSVTLPNTATAGNYYVFQLGNTAPLTFTQGGGYLVEADSQFRLTKQNGVVTAYCLSGTGTNAGWLLYGRTAA
jgi:hypothetical protein